jgi:PAS domain S-box-containing protein
MSRDSLDSIDSSLSRWSAVFEIASRLVGASHVEAIASTLASCLESLVPFSRGLLLATGADGERSPIAAWGPGTTKGGKSELDGELAAAANAENAAIVSLANGSAIVLPLDGAAPGAIALARDEPFTSEELEALGLLVKPVGAALAAALRHEESERKRIELADIIEIGRSFAAFADERTLCGAIAERAAKLVGAPICFVALYDAHKKRLVARDPSYNAPVAAIGEFTLALGPPEATSQAARWIEPFYTNAPVDDPRIAPLLSTGFAPSSILCAPMRAKGETVGALIAANHPNGFDHKSARLFGAIAPQAAAALSNAHIYEAAQERAQREAMLTRITIAVHESLELDEVLDTTVRALGQSLDLCRCYIGIIDPSRFVVRIAHEYHVPEVGSTVGEFQIAGYGPGLLSLMERGEVFAVDDVAIDPRVEPFRDRFLDPLGVRSLMYVPVLQAGALAAVLGFSQCRRTRSWSPDEIDLASTVAHQVGVAMRQAQLYDRQRRTAKYRSLLNRINKLVRTSLDLDVLLETTVDALGSVLEVDRCFVLAPGPFRATVETATVRFEFCRTGATSIRGRKVPIRNRAREGPVGTIEEPLVVPDVSATPRLVSLQKAELLSLTETGAFISVRAVYGDQVLAILELDNCYGPREWSKEEVDLVVEVAAQLAVGIHNALLFRRVTRSEQQWNTTFNSMTDGVALLDPNGLVLQLNDSLLRLCNLDSHDEAIGHHCYELLYGEGEPLRDGPIERVLSSGQRIVVERDIAATSISLRESIDPIADDEGQIAGLVLVVRDVTRERDAERAIRYRNRQLAALNAIAAATIHAQDLKSIWEGAFARIVEVMGADAGAILVFDEEGEYLDPVVTHGGASRARSLYDRKSGSAMTSAVLAAEVPLALDELPEDGGNRGLRQAALEEVGMRAAIYASIRSQRRPVGILVVAHSARRDYTANERQLLTVAGQQIGAAVENAWLISSLQQALERVREANRLKDEFLAIVSHELRTPLTAIQGWAEVLSDPEMGQEERVEGLATIQQASESLTKLISDLLEMSRIETRMLRLDMQSIDPNYPVRAAIQTVRQMAEAKEIEIEADLAAGLPHVSADSGRLQQVLWNLLVNAIKFTPAGGHVWVTTDAPGSGDRPGDEATESASSARAGYVRIRVRDDGLGIDASFLPHVFERFRQAEGTMTRQFGGLGIGLSLVRSLIEAHGGEVHAESPGQGEGATFTILLPAEDRLADAGYAD